MSGTLLGHISETVRRDLEKADCIWTYEGLPRASEYHALLTSGQHSDGFANVGQFLTDYPDKREKIASLMVTAIEDEWPDHRLTRVVGADTSSTKLAEDVAHASGARHIKMIKVEDANGKRQVWDPSNDPLEENDAILHIEELITTSVSAGWVREGIILANPHIAEINFAPFLPVIVDRSDPDNRVERVGDSRILPMLRLEIRNYDPADCPYCKAGSKAIKPKEGNNWTLLTGQK